MGPDTQIYPVPAENYELHLTSSVCRLFRVVKDPGLPHDRLGLADYQQWTLSSTTAAYLSLCDGVRSHSEIAAGLTLPFAVMAERIAHHLAEETGAIRLCSTPNMNSPRPFVTGSFYSMAPLHFSVEITDTCNFTCDHCYVSASPLKHGRRSGADLIALFKEMWRGGVKIVELTGGECTTHPDFERVLTVAAETFHLVGIVTNGYLLGRRADLVAFVARFPNVCAQVSLDGIGTYHDKFRKHDGAFDAACAAITALAQRGVIVRVGMSVTPDNVDQVRDVFLCAKRLGARAFSAAPVTGFGRGSTLGMTCHADRAVQAGITAALEPFRDDPLLRANQQAVEKQRAAGDINCGAGWRSFGINGKTGEIRSCLYLADSKKFGSVDRENYNDIFERPEMAMFRDAPSPSPMLETCRDCGYVSECTGCFAKAFRVSETVFPDCPWRAKYFPGMRLSESPRENAPIVNHD